VLKALLNFNKQTTYGLNSISANKQCNKTLSTHTHAHVQYIC